MVDYLVVGCGIAGISIARLLADAGLKILIIDRKPYIGGACNDYYDEHGFLLHRHGPHMFHTKSSEVWNFLNRFINFNDYQHRVYTYCDGEFSIFPPKAINTIAPDLNECKNAEDYLYQVHGIENTDKYFRGYSEKHWGLGLKDLPVSIVSRVRLRTSDDPRYFMDKYQGMPIGGFSLMFYNMLDHPKIKVMLNTDYSEIANLKLISKGMVWTGGIDELLDYKYGKLAYRSRVFTYRSYKEEYHQIGAVVNYPNDYDFIRVLEVKHATGQQSPYTILMYEFPTEIGEPYYPFEIKGNTTTYTKYLMEFSQKYSDSEVYLLGRLATYKYLNMDTCVDNAFDLAKSILK
jgi:UDP-galactopyranose mutase